MMGFVDIDLETLAAEADLGLVAGRYRPGALLGQGGWGSVYRATDEHTGETVALKLLEPLPPGQSARVRREFAALSLLRVPGVAQLVDHGDHEGRGFLAMELVEGRPFPGCPTPVDWPTLEAHFIKLLQTLECVHGFGVVHRDLKPDNVLVGPDGPVVLDFGLARGAPLGTTMTAAGQILGTPRYLAPEQVRGERVDGRADLYALGVMAYEALGGRPPLVETGGVQVLLQRKLIARPPPLASVAPQVPAAVAALIDRLLAREPQDRPRTAAEVWAALARTRAHAQLPWLGPTHSVDALAAELAAGRSMRVVGPPGSGRRRCLREAIAQSGVEAHWTKASKRPFGSLAEHVDLEALEGEGVEGVETFVARMLAERGGVWVVGETAGLDRWTRACFESAAETLQIAKIARSGVGLLMEPLTESALRPLFAGPDRVLRRRVRGAAALHERTGGWPEAVTALVGQWVAMGRATWSDDHLLSLLDPDGWLGAPEGTAGVAATEVDGAGLGDALEDVVAWVVLAGQRAREDLLAQLSERPAWELGLELRELERLGVLRVHEGRWLSRGPALALRRWPRAVLQAAHGRLASLLPRGAPSRLEHLAAAGVLDELREEALLRARHALDVGRLEEACATANQGLDAMVANSDPRPLLAALAESCVGQQVPSPIPILQRALERARRTGHPQPDLEALASAALAAHRGALDEVHRALGDHHPEEPSVRRWMAALRIRAATLTGLTAEARELEALERWAEEGPEARALWTMWRGLLQYRRGAYEDAVRLFGAAVTGAQRPIDRLSARNNRCLARIELGALDEARAEARAMLAEASEAGLSIFVLYAEWALRTIAYRLDEASAPDLELVQAAFASEAVAQAALIAFTEAAVAWRAGSRLAAELAGRASEAWAASGSAFTWLARALELFLQPSARAEDCEAVHAHLEGLDVELVQVQAWSLLCAAHPSPPAGWREAVVEIAKSAGAEPDRRMELLSLEECRRLAQKGRS